MEIELDSEIEPITDQVNNTNTRPDLRDLPREQAAMNVPCPLDELEFMSSQWGFPRPHSTVAPYGVGPARPRSYLDFEK